MAEREDPRSFTSRIKKGQLAPPEEVGKYYAEENHTQAETAERFSMSRKTLERYLKFFGIKKDYVVPQVESENSEPQVEGVKSLVEVDENNAPLDLIDRETARFQEIKYEHEGDIEEAMFQFCYEFNYFYDPSLLGRVVLSRSEEEIAKLPLSYIEAVQENHMYEGRNFFSQLTREGFERLTSEDLATFSLTEDDKKNRQQVINILGYDPFRNDDLQDRPQLYHDLVGMLTENMRKDVPKQKAAVEVVRSYSNIGKYQRMARDIMSSGQTDEATQEKLDTLLGVIAKVQNSINQTTDKNGFSNARTIGSGGQGMLSDVMNQVEDQGYDPGITNFYDIATSKAIEEVSNISYRALLNQVKLSNTDYAEILTQQAELVWDAQHRARQAEEALRLTKEKLTKQELLEELAGEYRRKGISEEEIEEFINREYNLYKVK